MTYSFEIDKERLEVKVYASSPKSVANIVHILKEAHGIVASHTEPSEVLGNRGEEDVYKATVMLPSHSTRRRAEDILSALYTVIKQEGRYVE